ncbi:hypothetical protein BOTBODRAFT_66891 [Botryobasidium botryosum FD-172 SS1]|uniref:Uncharacterized protein n=1 Tax=Botryobasidium botryosum (strain FD-172 SS1) TaxID=930990 RepID=A0A067MMM4_BOTB1|nr:hypothetical protein BOTBODRAFT_66891 [Botryobasidium botryosum FD-172 SS1]
MHPGFTPPPAYTRIQRLSLLSIKRKAIRRLPGPQSLPPPLAFLQSTPYKTPYALAPFLSRPLQHTNLLAGRASRKLPHTLSPKPCLADPLPPRLSCIPVPHPDESLGNTLVPLPRRLFSSQKIVSRAAKLHLPCTLLFPPIPLLLRCRRRRLRPRLPRRRPARRTTSQSVGLGTGRAGYHP